MKSLGELSAKAQKAAKHRKYHWARRPNGFSDMPIWRVVAASCNMPVYQVLAFVNRLEELANNAANFGEVRGSLTRFKPAEFGAALGMTADEAARLYAALEEPDVGWISFDHIADFYDRNPDRDEDAEGVRLRKRRQRSRDAIRKTLARLARVGKIDEARRRSIEISLLGISDDELRDLQNQLAREELSTPEERHIVTSRDNVTVTPEQIRNINSSVVENSEDSASSAAQGQQGEDIAIATEWIDSAGKKMLVEYIQIRPALAETYIERWRRDLQDDVALMAIIKGADDVGYIGARFHTIITEQVRRHVSHQQHGPPLPLMPPRPQSLLKRSNHG